MAVFMVKGYRGASFVPQSCPPAVNPFTDFTCSGPYAAYAPFIIQLYNDHVTGGCGLNTFCPGDPIGEWETLVWLAKGGPPNGSGTIPFWPTYHPVPRGSTYTLRDEGNRVVTEIAGGLSGSGTASLNVARDNVYLGGLLVASSAGAWSYSASDNLGSIRAVWNASGTKTEDHRYWPYGEDATATLNQHLAFQGMERNDATNQYYDHARTQQFNIGRFLSTDVIDGYPEEPRSWNRYVFGFDNPMVYTDPLGLEPDNPSGQSKSAGDKRLDPGFFCFFFRCQSDVTVTGHATGSTWNPGGGGFPGTTGRFTLRGLAPLVDGAIPFSDPLALAHWYDPDDLGMHESYIAGLAIQESVLVTATAERAVVATAERATLNAWRMPIGKREGSFITENIFRWGSRPFRHFHLGPKRLMGHHLPVELRTYLGHARALIIQALKRLGS